MELLIQDLIVRLHEFGVYGEIEQVEPQEDDGSFLYFQTQDESGNKVTFRVMQDEDLVYSEWDIEERFEGESEWYFVA